MVAKPKKEYPKHDDGSTKVVGVPLSEVANQVLVTPTMTWQPSGVPWDEYCRRAEAGEFDNMPDSYYENLGDD